MAKDVSPAPESRPRSPKPPATVEKPLATAEKPLATVEKPLATVEKPTEAIPANGDAKSDWDASSDENHDDAKAQGEAVKDSWDASSDDEEKSRKFEQFSMKLYLIYIQQNLLYSRQRATSSYQKPHLPQRQGQHRNQHLRNEYLMGRRLLNRLLNLLRKRNQMNPRNQMTMTTMIPRTLMDQRKKKN